MNVALLKDLLAVPTVSWCEHLMVDWLVSHVIRNVKGATVTVDPYRNVYVVKGSAALSPCVAAHIDTVQFPRPVEIIQEGTRLVGNVDGQQAGIGADDKAGVFVCLNMLSRFDDIRAVFFATEEVGCQGARRADPKFFDGVAYLIEYDCPSRNMLSYTAGGERLFANRGEFIRRAWPVLQKHGTTLWQHHPYTDVMEIRRRFPISCLNLSCGYYNWHADNEFVSLPDVELAIAQGAELIRILGSHRQACPIDLHDDADEPLVPVGHLHVPEAQ